MQGFILSMSKTRTEDMIVRILTPSHIKTLYRFYGARHSIINIGRKIDFEEEAQLGFLPRLRNILHLAHKWELEAQRLYMWQHFIKLLHKHLAEIEEIESFYFELLEWGAARLVVQNPKRVSLEMYAKLLQHEGRTALGDLESAGGHSALRLKSAILHSDFRLRTSSARPQSSLESPDFSSQILECLAESSPKDSEEISESTSPVIASEAKQSIRQDSKSVDCHADKSARNDSKTESIPHASLESKTDSETPSGEVYPLRDKNQIARSADLEASSGASGISASDCKGEGATSRAVAQPQTHTCTFKPLPLNKKENTESNEARESLEVKTADSKAIDSESKTRAESAGVRDSEKLDSESLPCFICQEPLDSLIALGRAFLPAHKRCIGGKLYARKRIARFLQSASTIWLEDSEVEELWEILSLGL